jgi:hypothetical protein
VVPEAAVAIDVTPIDVQHGLSIETPRHATYNIYFKINGLRAFVTRITNVTWFYQHKIPLPREDVSHSDKSLRLGDSKHGDFLALIDCRPMGVSYW